jgi:hypothetical protein
VTNGSIQFELVHPEIQPVHYLAEQVEPVEQAKGSVSTTHPQSNFVVYTIEILDKDGPYLASASNSRSSMVSPAFGDGLLTRIETSLLD